MTPIHLERNISKATWARTSNLVRSFVCGMPSGRKNNSPESGRDLGHVTTTILAVRSAIPATAWLLVQLCVSVYVLH